MLPSEVVPFLDNNNTKNKLIQGAFMTLKNDLPIASGSEDQKTPLF